MKEMNIAPILAGAMLREQIGGKYDICFQETRISFIPFDKSIKQGGKESPCFFNLMMRNVFRALQEEWKVLRMGVKTRKSVGRQEEDRVSHMIFADNCYLFAESKEQILKMIGDATEELKKRGFDWKVTSLRSRRSRCSRWLKDVSCSAFMEAGSMRSLGLPPMASSICVSQLRATCVFLTVASLQKRGSLAYPLSSPSGKEERRVLAYSIR